MSKEIELKFAEKLKENYDCRIIINNEEPYTLFCASDFGKILGIKNIRENLKNSKTKKLIETITNRGKQKIIFINYNTIIKSLTNCRKPKIIEFANKMNLDLETKIYSCIESDTLQCIIDSFKGQEIILQYKINRYLLDLYFPKYKLIIECDENNHTKIKNKLNDIEREIEIKNLIKNCTFIRYMPDEKDFNIFIVINKIFNHILNY
jgi:very-short-patch-repair endonuclease